jgi:HlyD family secretion protein
LVVAGTVEVREVNVAPLASGRLVRLLKDEGDTVRAGDTVAVLQQPGLDEQIAEFQARASAAVARLRDLEAGAREPEIESARATLSSALADSQRTAADLRRVEDLAQRGVTSDQQRDLARASFATAAARVATAREQLRLLEAGARHQQIVAAGHESEAAGAALRAALARRDELTLRAPGDGVILLRLAERGEVVPVGAPVVTIGLVHEPWVRAYVGEPSIARVRLGAPAKITVDAYPKTQFPGKVSEISPQAEFTPRAALTERERADLVFAIKVAIDDASGRLKPGMPVDLHLQLAPPP